MINAYFLIFIIVVGLVDIIVIYSLRRDITQLELWRKFVDKRLDDLLMNANSTFCNVSERMDKMQYEINKIKSQQIREGL